MPEPQFFTCVTLNIQQIYNNLTTKTLDPRLLYSLHVCAMPDSQFFTGVTLNILQKHNNYKTKTLDSRSHYRWHFIVTAEPANKQCTRPKHLKDYCIICL